MSAAPHLDHPIDLRRIYQEAGCSDQCQLTAEWEEALFTNSVVDWLLRNQRLEKTKGPGVCPGPWEPPSIPLQLAMQSISGAFPPVNTPNGGLPFIFATAFAHFTTTRKRDKMNSETPNRPDDELARTQRLGLLVGTYAQALVTNGVPVEAIAVLLEHYADALLADGYYHSERMHP